MREILFRGKTIVQNKQKTPEWVFGGIVHQTDFYGNAVDRWFVIDGTSTFDYDMGENIEVEKETVCQYTGLNDSTTWDELSENEKGKFLSEWNHKENRQNIKEDWNGRKIFENDIVSAPFLNKFRQYENEVGVVKWGKGIFSFLHVKEEYGRHILGYVSNIRVIGNIFDNAELLKGDAK